jgi:hypothetical protein
MSEFTTGSESSIVYIAAKRVPRSATAVVFGQPHQTGARKMHHDSYQK